MDGWTLRLTIPNHEDGGTFPADIVVEEDDEGRKDWECESRLYVPNGKLIQMRVENIKLKELACMERECASHTNCVESCPYHYVKDGFWECERDDLRTSLGLADGS